MPETLPAKHTHEVGEWQAKLTSNDLEAMLSVQRDGYWHFQVSHQLVVERNYDCTSCHSAQLPFAPVIDRESRRLQTEVCTSCH